MLSFAGVFIEAGVRLNTIAIVQSYMHCLPTFREQPFAFFFPQINVLKLYLKTTQGTSVFLTVIAIHQALGAFL